MSGGFCFVKGQLVECASGRVQDCNTKQLRKCPLTEERTKQTGGFCFCKGAIVECSSGRVQDCNMKKNRKCPKEE